MRLTKKDWQRYTGSGWLPVNVYWSWDDRAAQLDVPGASEDDRHARLREAAPLSVLASQLGVPRVVLDYKLGHADEHVDVPLIGPDCTEAIAAYLASPLRAPGLAVKPEPRFGARQELFLPIWMVEELEAHARRVDTTVGVICWAIWEAAKPELFRTVPIADEEPADDEVSDPPPRFMTAPRVVPPKDVVVPRLVPVFAKVLPSPSSKMDKVLVDIMLPLRVREELQQFATGAGRGLSWSMQKAYHLVRDRVHAATKPE